MVKGRVRSHCECPHGRVISPFEVLRVATIIVPAIFVTEITSHALSEAPNECCGMLGGKDAQAASRYPLRNLSPAPELRYFAAPEDIFLAMRQMRDAGEELIAIYHSHPRGFAYPSRTDIELAYYPEIAYLIVSLTPAVELAAFSIRKEIVEPIVIVVPNEESVP